MTDKIRLSTIQAASAFFDKQAALQIALDWIDRAAKEKPDVITLGEAWLPGLSVFHRQSLERNMVGCRR